MKHMGKTIRKAWRVGGWAPILVFAIHVFLIEVLGLYAIWPDADMPMHLGGGLAIAFFTSRCFQTFPHESAKRSRLAVLELLLIGCVTATVAVFWEFAEFGIDRFCGTDMQVSLANTMQDLALGIGGAGLLILYRARRLHVGTAEIGEVMRDWIDFRDRT
jgi:hypothetical protein